MSDTQHSINEAKYIVRKHTSYSFASANNSLKDGGEAICERTLNHFGVTNGGKSMVWSKSWANASDANLISMFTHRSPPPLVDF